MFLKLNRTRLGQLLLRFPKDFVIEGQKASGKVTLIHPEVIQCPSTPVPLEKDIVHDNTTADDMKISAESPSGMEKNDTQGNVFSQAGRNYYGDTTLGVPGNDGSTLTLSARSVGYLKNSRLADLGMGLSVDVLGLTKGIVQHVVHGTTTTTAAAVVTATIGQSWDSPRFDTVFRPTEVYG
ncbi:hypothetical protein Pmar_PMAR003605 [Perkinsus marinus ATCC 50983]|uniref:Uncharacterized protein n=1 Tax=Perkinsus marinus (strain ATCC 50983 / TXsc) TaxID=423536 RepID=C5KHT0_PERM5|nr:hypothetical protein Pmar_PMAR003605 [Perkinsus marinus ATCC 50983]EER16142.1 hypothetical protein Pmar_PMAR003605 [Perkinsus marinus ATCC 50983]|eukprot:XP_002784346.1 hypothetical protein Pmar_PMAR003605 [Perkinsus marinus ATCC 50983]